MMTTTETSDCNKEMGRPASYGKAGQANNSNRFSSRRNFRVAQTFQIMLF